MERACQSLTFLNTHFEDCGRPVESGISGECSFLTFIGVDVQNPHFNPEDVTIADVGDVASVFLMRNSPHGYLLQNYRNRSADLYDYDIVDVQASNKAAQYVLHGSSTVSGWQQLRVGRDAEEAVIWDTEYEN
jgi:hypothetical protein